jgi:hypothetical protein
MGPARGLPVCPRPVGGTGNRRRLVRASAGRDHLCVSGAGFERVRTRSAAYALLVSLESYDVATRERGWSPGDIERWWHSALVELLMA